ncbi:hypothetical protein [Azoarcus sp. KH32C]|uniref:hypothetical protein n=1 Tax=Azoarcus sp. KH32C TaxID=748247 RepID=UPI0002386358|nr:hypothetical protein [Azoarcus sp. KH32C]BAL22503.1 hypothetical protein AZKH_0157 [Azoarcus sp. KH32C]
MKPVSEYLALLWTGPLAPRLLAAALAVASTPAMTPLQSTYRCVDAGRVIYADTPCYRTLAQTSRTPSSTERPVTPTTNAAIKQSTIGG